jgi:hypothetical protein
LCRNSLQEYSFICIHWTRITMVTFQVHLILCGQTVCRTTDQSFLPFMEPEGSLPFSQKPANGPCSETDGTCPHPHTSCIFELHTNVTLQPKRTCIGWSLPLKIYRHFSSSHACYMPCILHPYWFDSLNNTFWKTNYGVSHYSVFG